MLVYIAGGWFTDEQKEAISEIEDALSMNGVEYLSPKDEIVWKPGMNPKDILEANVKEMGLADVIIASTAGKDMGTLFECGYAYAKQIPLVYYFKPHAKDAKFNVMLASTAVAVLTDWDQLWSYAEMLHSEIIMPEVSLGWEGDME